MTPFSCSNCSSTVYFENTHCGVCQAVLGYVPSLCKMVAFDGDAAAVAAPSLGPATVASNIPAPPVGGMTGAPMSGTSTALPDQPWTAQGPGQGDTYQPCANRRLWNACNWMLDSGQAPGLCSSCRLTEIIPALQESTNLPRWRWFEAAKRRLLFTLDHMGLMPEPKTGPQDRLGLSFRLLVPMPGEQVLTGHDDGVITLNALEADDDYREKTRVQMGEPMRTLLGHLRHETSHYLQYRHVDNTPGADVCRQMFGDERADYPEALKRYYEGGPAANWPDQFVSAYASAHPWEDWAETCAHYLLVIDAVQTAAAWGLTLEGPAPAHPTTDTVLTESAAADVVLLQWLPVAQFLNAMNRSLGHRDAYPFLMPDAVVAKMDTVRQLLTAGARALTEGASGTNPTETVHAPEGSHATVEPEMTAG